jgi:hypothetical protein
MLESHIYVLGLHITILDVCVRMYCFWLWWPTCYGMFKKLI